MNLEFIHCSSHKASVATVIVGGKRYCRLCYIRDKLAEVGPALSEPGAHNICYDNSKSLETADNCQLSNCLGMTRAARAGPSLSKNVDNWPSRETALEIVRECDKIIAELGVKSDNQ